MSSHASSPAKAPADPPAPTVPEPDNDLLRLGTIMASTFEFAMRNAGSNNPAGKYPQCELYFYANPHKFPSNEKKVLFTFTYLSDVALEWFEQKFANAQDEPDSSIRDLFPLMHTLSACFCPPSTSSIPILPHLGSADHFCESAHYFLDARAMLSAEKPRNASRDFPPWTIFL
ncbi:hypothetical protein BDY19DRAFT_1054333 [Irpex rosettiformis]|uniref:Uncharacterized protein n=1 Tax=Irpex rosettiformis TaxID=378272 RepID=A0ACB8UEX7_9APHY|nr:hypothetical protein BDY19DRAFT_1054333 [Irpex rosettiformis]